MDLNYEELADAALLSASPAINLPPDNVTTDLTWLASQVTTPEQCYLPDGAALIRAAASASPSEVLATETKLAKKFGKDWRVSRFRANIRESKSELTVPAQSGATPLLLSSTGTPRKNLANAITKLSTVPIAFDSFACKVIHQAPSPWGTTGAWGDRDDGEAANYLQHPTKQHESVDVSSATAHEAAFILASRKSYHPVRDWLNSLKWDETPRLQFLMPHYFGCPDGVYAREISQMWMISAVARIMRPGCMSKYMIVLEGLQDDGKSRGLRALANGHTDGDRGVQWYRDRLPPLDHKDLGMFMQGVWIIEIAELATIQRSEWEDTKSFISTQTDSFRAPYGHNMQDYPRQCVFAGTVNVNRGVTPEWGKDPTGLVRFWPIRSGEPNIDAILTDREQLWAEAMELYKQGRPWWGDKDFDDLARKEQSERMPEDPLAELVDSAIGALISSLGYSPETGISVSEICTKLNYGSRERASNQAAIGKVLSGMGWTRFKQRSRGSEPLPRWKQPEGV